jgi:hypothetical protein
MGKEKDLLLLLLARSALIYKSSTNPIQQYVSHMETSAAFYFFHKTW